jgi:hypothetical protein
MAAVGAEGRVTNDLKILCRFDLRVESVQRLGVLGNFRTNPFKLVGHLSISAPCRKALAPNRDLSKLCGYPTWHFSLPSPADRPNGKGFCGSPSSSSSQAVTD